jgi:hypothetical protein
MDAIDNLYTDIDKMYVISVNGTHLTFGFKTRLNRYFIQSVDGTLREVGKDNVNNFIEKAKLILERSI